MSEERREGEFLGGRYRIGPVIGQGAMGVVHRGEQVLLREKVAIKFLTAASPDATERFRQEARSARSIQSRNVVKVHDLAVCDDGVPYIVMELLEGYDLATRLNKSGPLPLKEATNFILQACEGVAAAHDLRIVHRDLKPANLFVCADKAGPVIKVLDFGISKNTLVRTVDSHGGAAGGGLTEACTILGSPSYMSPEQMNAASEVDARTDVWALGVTFYQLLTDELPFQGDTPFQIASSIKSVLQRRSIHRRLSGIARGLDRVLAPCFAELDQRYPDARALADALAPFARARPAPWRFWLRILGALAVMTAFVAGVGQLWLRARTTDRATGAADAAGAHASAMASRWDSPEAGVLGSAGQTGQTGQTVAEAGSPAPSVAVDVGAAMIPIAPTLLTSPWPRRVTAQHWTDAGAEVAVHVPEAAAVVDPPAAPEAGPTAIASQDADIFGTQK